MVCQMRRSRSPPRRRSRGGLSSRRALPRHRYPSFFVIYESTVGGLGGHPGKLTQEAFVEVFLRVFPGPDGILKPGESCPHIAGPRAVRCPYRCPVRSGFCLECPAMPLPPVPHRIYLLLRNFWDSAKTGGKKSSKKRLPYLGRRKLSARKKGREEATSAVRNFHVQFLIWPLKYQSGLCYNEHGIM